MNARRQPVCASGRAARRGRRRAWVAAVLGAGWFGTCAAAAQAAKLQVVTAESRVEYHIDHTVTPVTNVAGPASGIAETGDGGELVGGQIEVDLRQLQTGIGMRDRHVKGPDCLDVERFPTARFTLAGVQAAGDSVAAMGSLELHGQVHDLHVPLRVTAEGSRLRVEGRFSFVLADWGIKRPKRMLLAAGKTVDVRLDLVFAP